ncbi:MAG: hypothetical protein U9P14_05720 [Gemmatimonadota bacterium]|nr:hypothetical protein [Gemmatimonadota bacterium]
MKIDHVFQRNRSPALDIKEKSKAEKPAKDASSAPLKDESCRALKTDTVDISETARSLQRTDSEMNIQQDLGDPGALVRQDNVLAAKAKVLSGSLLSDEIVSKTADAIINSGSLDDIIKGDEVKARFEDLKEVVAGAGESKLTGIRQKIEEGFYDQPEVTDKIAGDIMENFLT